MKSHTHTHNFSECASRRVQIFGQANTPLKRWLLDFATRRKESELRSGVVRKDSMWDKLIFNKVQVGQGTMKEKAENWKQGSFKANQDVDDCNNAASVM